MKHLLPALLKRLPAGTLARAAVELAAEVEQSREQAQQEKTRREVEHHAQLRRDAAERRKAILNRP